jgi:hypothetical protein
MAFDGAGHLWLDAALIVDGKETDVLLRYTPGSTAMLKFPVAKACSVGAGTPSDDLYSASDGAVWVICVNTKLGTGGGALVQRLTPDGGVTSVHVVVQGPAGSLENLAGLELPGESLLGPMAQMAGGFLWNLPGTFAGASGYAKLLPNGSEYWIIDSGTSVVEQGRPSVAADLELFGNGTDSLAELVTCSVMGSDNSIKSHNCLVSVSPVGTRSVIAVIPDYDGYNLLQVNQAVMDADGGMWVMIQGTANGDAPNGQYYFESDPGGATTVYPFTVPGASGPISIAHAQPVITDGSGLWTVQGGTQSGSIVEVLPQG